MCKKVKYKDFGNALKKMQVINRKHDFDLKRIYKCPHCRCWHHTSQELKDIDLG